MSENSDPAAQSSADTAKDKFREALERKRTHQAERAGEGHGDSKIHGEHGVAGAKRTFRRKAGG